MLALEATLGPESGPLDDIAGGPTIMLEEAAGVMYVEEGVTAVRTEEDGFDGPLVLTEATVAEETVTLGELWTADDDGIAALAEDTATENRVELSDPPIAGPGGPPPPPPPPLGNTKMDDVAAGLPRLLLCATIAGLEGTEFWVEEASAEPGAVAGTEEKACWLETYAELDAPGKDIGANDVEAIAGVVAGIVLDPKVDDRQAYIMLVDHEVTVTVSAEQLGHVGGDRLSRYGVAPAK